MGRRLEVPAAFTAAHDDYTAALERAPLDADTRRTYASRIRAFLAWLDAADLDKGRPPPTRRDPVRRAQGTACASVAGVRAGSPWPRRSSPTTGGNLVLRIPFNQEGGKVTPQIREEVAEVLNRLPAH
ncbi:hypothetical protein ACBJ59_50440 [Nonomuraea sp. MTCD27]|uniref:hypothetical protein n=1 Tax=Nonomuraea sp. MTCD27 TaxID=1676747 RepID=UPI0035BF2DC9